ncbi:BQ5605_C004g02748 [Microbotryum silenes-dioicae]|uniref:BQ5605_C004g02748 protein n=1 Tax=Microbotryum silenes-dioicae TaxID=796604 RepID=A0A2X0MD59_9BASI|nr:BQ5605_C004g02748 [Microbotryum silenes-dioicae]
MPAPRGCRCIGSHVCSDNEMGNTQGTVNCKTARYVRMSMEADNSQRAGEVVSCVELGVSTLVEKRLLAVVDVSQLPFTSGGLTPLRRVDAWH